jgi:hypothetical protein
VVTGADLCLRAGFTATAPPPATHPQSAKPWLAVQGQSRQPDWQIFFLSGLQLGQFVSMYGNCF